MPTARSRSPGSGKTAEFNVGGAASATALELQFTQTGIEPPGDWMGLQGAMATTYRVDRVSPTRAEGVASIATTDGGPFPVTGSASISLDCSTCSA